MQLKVFFVIDFVLEKAVSFKHCVDAISVLISEAEFIISEKGIALKATDPSQISMVDFEIPRKAFKEFKVDKEVKIGLDLDYFSQLMSRAKASDSLIFSFDEKNSRLNLSFQGSSKRSFSIPLIDVSAQELPTPKIDFEAELKFKAEALQEGLKDASLISNHVSLGVDSEKFFLKANSSKGSLSTEIGKSDKNVIELNVKKPGQAMFPLDYLQNMLKVAGSDTPITLELKANHPIKISYSIDEASISYYLAPRIEE